MLHQCCNQPCCNQPCCCTHAATNHVATDHADRGTARPRAQAAARIAATNPFDPAFTQLRQLCSHPLASRQWAARFGGPSAKQPEILTMTTLRARMVTHKQERLQALRAGQAKLLAQLHDATATVELVHDVRRTSASDALARERAGARAPSAACAQLLSRAEAAAAAAGGEGEGAARGGGGWRLIFPDHVKYLERSKDHKLERWCPRPHASVGAPCRDRECPQHNAPCPFFRLSVPLIRLSVPLFQSSVPLIRLP